MTWHITSTHTHTHMRSPVQSSRKRQRSIRRFISRMSNPCLCPRNVVIPDVMVLSIPTALSCPRTRGSQASSYDVDAFSLSILSPPQLGSARAPTCTDWILYYWGFFIGSVGRNRCVIFLVGSHRRSAMLVVRSFFGTHRMLVVQFMVGAQQNNNGRVVNNYTRYGRS